MTNEHSQTTPIEENENPVRHWTAKAWALRIFTVKIENEVAAWQQPALLYSLRPRSDFLPTKTTNFSPVSG